MLNMNHIQLIDYTWGTQIYMARIPSNCHFPCLLPVPGSQSIRQSLQSLALRRSDRRKPRQRLRRSRSRLRRSRLLRLPRSRGCDGRPHLQDPDGSCRGQRQRRSTSQQLDSVLGKFQGFTLKIVVLFDRYMVGNSIRMYSQYEWDGIDKEEEYS